MADITQQTEITGEWTELSAPLAMQDGTEYAVDVHKAQTSANVFWAETDDQDLAPSDAIIGHPIEPYGKQNPDSRVYTKRSGVFPWMRTSKGTAKVESTPTS